MSVDAEKCAKLRASKNFENLTIVKVMTKTKVAPFYLGHGVVCITSKDVQHSMRH